MRLPPAKVFSLVSRGSRHQFAVAVATVTVIPALTLYILLTGQPDLGPAGFTWLAIAAMVLVAAGYALLSRYHITIVRLRSYLEKLAQGAFPGSLDLVRWGDEIAAIERALTLIVEQLSQRVRDLSAELLKIEWLLTKSVKEGSLEQIRNQRAALRREAAPTVLPGGLRETVGRDVLEDMLGDSLDLLEHCAGVLEKDGSCALFLIASDWCRLLCGESEKLNALSGRLPPPACHTACRVCHQQEAGLRAVTTGQAVDTPCPGGIWIHTVPVRAGQEVVGAISVGYGSPPREAHQLDGVAARYQLPVATLAACAAAYDDRPPFIVSVAKNRLLTSAQLLGEIVERKRALQELHRHEEELRRHRDHLDQLVRERTAELTQTNEQLRTEINRRRQAEQLKDEFLSTVSHELRTPLAIAKEGVSLLADGIPGPLNEQQRHILSLALSHIERLGRLINDLLDISKIEAGHVELLWRPVDFVELVRQTVQTFATTAREKGLELRTFLPPTPLELVGDPDRIVQVLSNLLSNAIKFTSQGHVEVTVADRGTTVECTVADTGIGIDPQHHARLFRKFEQFHRASRPGLNGTGLGLAIVKDLVELHGGRVWAESTPGQGSRFSFSLPKQRDQVLDSLRSEIVRARRQQGRFALLALRLAPTTASSSPEQVPALLEAMVSAIKAQHIFREHDTLLPRPPDELLVVVNVDLALMPRILGRLRHQLPPLLAALPGGAGFAILHGTASYPEDGESVETLLKLLRDGMVLLG